MLGNEPALSKYMKEAPRRRDEGIISKDMMTQIGFMGIWLVILSFLFLKLPVLTNLFDNKAQHLTAYFVLFIFSALFNGFNVRDERFGIFKRLNENPDFLKYFYYHAGTDYDRKRSGNSISSIYMDRKDV